MSFLYNLSFEAYSSVRYPKNNPIFWFRDHAHFRKRKKLCGKIISSFSWLCSFEIRFMRQNPPDYFRNWLYIKFSLKNGASKVVARLFFMYVPMIVILILFFSIFPTSVQFVYPTSYKATTERRYTSCCIAVWFLSCKMFIIQPPVVQKLCLSVGLSVCYSF